MFSEQNYGNTIAHHSELCVGTRSIDDIGHLVFTAIGVAVSFNVVGRHIDKALSRLKATPSSMRTQPNIW